MNKGRPVADLRTRGKHWTRGKTGSLAARIKSERRDRNRVLLMEAKVLANSTLPRAVVDALSDFSDLVGKQIQLAKAEIATNISSGIAASAWMIAAALLFLLAGFLVVEAVVFGIASLGIALHWACLIVAAALAAIGVGLIVYARSTSRNALTPARTIRQINKDISAAKEQLR